MADASEIKNIARALIREEFDAVYRNQFLPGIIRMYGGSTAPEGYLTCDGSAVSRNKYPDLFGVIGTTFGAGDGSTTFNVPDLRGRTAIGSGTGTGGGSSGAAGTAPSGGSALTARSIGAWVGAETHTLSAAESGLPAHRHAQGQPTAGGSLAVAGGAAGTAIVTNAIGSRYDTADVAAAAASQGHNNVQPAVVVQFIIKI